MIVIYEIRVLHLFHHSWILAVALFIGIASLTAYIKPYRKSYMNLLDTLLLLHIALLCLLITTSFKRSTVFIAICEILLFTAPLIIFLLSVIVKSAINFKHFLFPKNCLCYKHCHGGDEAEAYIQDNIANDRSCEECQPLLQSASVKSIQIASYA